MQVLHVCLMRDYFYLADKIAFDWHFFPQLVGPHIAFNSSLASLTQCANCSAYFKSVNSLGAYAGHHCRLWFLSKGPIFQSGLCPGLAKICETDSLNLHGFPLQMSWWRILWSFCWSGSLSKTARWVSVSNGLALDKPRNILWLSSAHGSSPVLARSNWLLNLTVEASSKESRRLGCRQDLKKDVPVSSQDPLVVVSRSAGWQGAKTVP